MKPTKICTLALGEPQRWSLQGYAVCIHLLLLPVDVSVDGGSQSDGETTIQFAGLVMD